jgi:hypothetical protein
MGPAYIDQITAKPIAVLAVVILAAAGCGARPVEGGTPGVLRAGSEPLAEIQVTVHQSENEASRWEPIGFADTAADGTFRLLLRQATGPLQLPAGTYRFTLESVGSPIRIPKELTRADTTPLQVSWSGEEPVLTLDLPQKLQAVRR